MYQVKKATFWVMTVLCTLSFVLGGCSMATAPDTKKEAARELEEELKKNAQELEEQQGYGKKETGDDKDDDMKNTEATDTFSEDDNPGTSVSSVTAIGDSVMLGAALAIKEILPDCIIDAKESRQVSQAADVADVLESQGELGNTVIISLGTNGPFSESSGQDLIDRLGAERTIYWITAYGEHLTWQEDSNKMIYRLAEENDNVQIIDWAQNASGHSEWFYEDGIHLNLEGQEAYATLIADSIL